MSVNEDELYWIAMKTGTLLFFLLPFLKSFLPLLVLFRPLLYIFLHLREHDISPLFPTDKTIYHICKNDQ